MSIFVTVNGYNFDFYAINAGVLQGSVVAFTWFLLYINALFFPTSTIIHSYVMTGPFMIGSNIGDKSNV